MDIREVQQLEGVKIIDPKASRNRRLIVGALTAVAIGVLGWILFGQPATKPPVAPAVKAAPAAPAASPQPTATEGTARQATGTIADSAGNPLPAIRLATPPQAATATAPASGASGAAASPVSTAVSSPSPDASSSVAPSALAGPAASPSATPAPSAPASAAAASTPALKLDTEFASAKRIVPFAFNRVGVGPLGRLAVKELVPMAKQADKVNVRGRTDGLGNARANREVALGRARTVYNAFIHEGVDRQKMRLGYCTTCFVAANDSEAGRRLNRRVEVELIMPREQIAQLPKPVHAPEALAPLAPLAASGSLQRLPR